MQFVSQYPLTFCAIVLAVIAIGIVVWWLTIPVRQAIDKPEGEWQYEGRTVTEEERRNIEAALAGLRAAGAVQPLPPAGRSFIGMHAAPMNAPEPQSAMEKVEAAARRKGAELSDAETAEIILKHEAEKRMNQPLRQAIGRMHRVIPIHPALQPLVSEDIDTINSLQRDGTVIREPRPASMYEGSKHQPINPAIMKQVLSDHFGELNPELPGPTGGEWDADSAELILISAGARRMPCDESYVLVLDTANVAMLADRLNNLSSQSDID